MSLALLLTLSGFLQHLLFGESLAHYISHLATTLGCRMDAVGLHKVSVGREERVKVYHLAMIMPRHLLDDGRYDVAND